MWGGLPWTICHLLFVSTHAQHWLGMSERGSAEKRHNPRFAHAASFFTCAKQKQLHGRAEANLIGFNSGRGSSEGSEKWGNWRKNLFYVWQEYFTNYRRRGTMMPMITFEGHKTNRPFHNQGHGVSNHMKAKASNPSISGENELLLLPIQIYTRAWGLHGKN